jgi:hypothetical protein
MKMLLFLLNPSSHMKRSVGLAWLDSILYETSFDLPN